MLNLPIIDTFSLPHGLYPVSHSRGYLNVFAMGAAGKTLTTISKFTNSFANNIRRYSFKGNAAYIKSSAVCKLVPCKITTGFTVAF